MLQNEALRKAVTDLQMMERMKGIGHPDTIANRAIVQTLEKTFSDSAREAAAEARKGKGGGFPAPGVSSTQLRNHLSREYGLLPSGSQADYVKRGWREPEKNNNQKTLGMVDKEETGRMVADLTAAGWKSQEGDPGSGVTNSPHTRYSHPDDPSTYITVGKYGSEGFFNHPVTVNAQKRSKSAA